jgi:hypothetical protein
MYERIRVGRGEMPIDSRRFGQIMAVIAELRRITPKGEPPDAKELTGPANDALAAAGIEVAIKPPVLPHGGGHGGPIGKGR